jgi:hypothetical protein
MQAKQGARKARIERERKLRATKGEEVAEDEDFETTTA